MIKSMTGYGKSVCELPGKVVTIEIKSLNSKQLDVYTRLPNQYREKDLEIRNLISQNLKRGKCEVNLGVEITDASTASNINIPIVSEYFKQIETIGKQLHIDYKNHAMQIIMRLPDTLRTEKEELNPEEWKSIEKGIIDALGLIDQFRVQEGKALEKDIMKRSDIIIQKLDEIVPFEKNRIKDVRERIESNLGENFDLEKVDQNRLEQELIYYMEKLDITEEKVRLRNHCKYFGDVISKEDFVGKKLGFIAQEMGREINTIGSKANNSDIQRLVVQMKDELEKIKEQLMNVL